MGRDDVKRVVAAMADSTVCKRLAAGDFTAVDGIELTAHEEVLVLEAASDYPDVEGFADLAILGEDHVGVKWEGPEFDAAKNAPLGGYPRALRYIEGGSARSG